MPTDNDLDDRNSTQAGDDHDTSGSKVDYESKYKGEAKRNARLAKQVETLQNQLDDALAAKEEADSKARNASKTANKDVQAKDETVTTLQKELAEAKEKIRKQTALEESRKIVQKDYKELTDPLYDGDLKLITDFEKPEDYTEYLKRMASRFGGQQNSQDRQQKQPTPEEIAAQKRQQAEGATPRMPTGSRNTGTQRTVDQIYQEMDELPLNAKGEQRMRELTNELNEITIAAKAKFDY